LPEQASSLIPGGNPALMFLGQLIFLQNPQFRPPTSTRPLPPAEKPMMAAILLSACTLKNVSKLWQN
jgi:hypothetical protein